MCSAHVDRFQKALECSWNHDCLCDSDPRISLLKDKRGLPRLRSDGQPGGIGYPGVERRRWGAGSAHPVLPRCWGAKAFSSPSRSFRAGHAWSSSASCWPSWPIPDRPSSYRSQIAHTGSRKHLTSRGQHRAAYGPVLKEREKNGCEPFD